jgi:hypothetical protein
METTMTRSRTKHLVFPLAACAALSLPIAALADGGDRIEGTWINDVQIVRCDDPSVVLARFQSMTSYLRGGVVIEGGSPATPPPAVSRSAGQGAWTRVDGQSIRAEIRAHFFDALGRLVRITEIRTEPTLLPGDDPSTADVVEPYTLSGWGTNTITTIDPLDGRVLARTSGCNHAVSRPMLVRR